MTPTIVGSPFHTAAPSEADWTALDDWWLARLGIVPVERREVGYQVTMLDLFCGAGGSSSGAHSIPGVKVVMAANHWPLAIETHNTNHPDTDHDCADLSQVEPRRYPRTDGLWASPECTNHSQAKGKKRNVASQPDLFGDTLPDEAAERSRATMWDVVRFTEHHQYKFVIVENVVDVVKWVGYRGWITTMTDMGYEHRVVYLNSMHANQAGLPAPQSRDRVYVCFWRKGDRRPDFEKWTRPRATCSVHGQIRAVQAWKKPQTPWGRYRAQYVYQCPRVECRNEVVEPSWLPAAYAIDWSLPGQRIGDRAKPLADKTRARIAAGLKKHWSPIHLEAGGNQYDSMDPKHPQHGQESGYVRAWPAGEPLRTLHTAGTKGLAYADGMLVPVEGRDGKQAALAADPMRTMTTRNETGLLVPAGGTWNEAPTPLSDPMRTRTTRDTEALVIPMRNNNTSKLASEPLDTVAANGNHHGLLLPYYSSGSIPKPTDQPIPTIPTVDHFAMITRQNTGGAEMSTAPQDVLRTLTTAGHQSLTEWTGELPDIDDCLFRMLEPHEVKVGMAFSRGYVMLGNKREQVKLAGNAVTPPAARDLVGMMVEALTGQLVLAA